MASSSPRRSVSFRSAEAAATAVTCSASSRCGSSSSSSSLTSLALAPVFSSVTSSTSSGSSHLTCHLTSAESLDQDSTGAATTSGVTAVAAAGSPSRRPRSSAINSDLHHLRHSGDSGDSGVSSPGPPSSEASEQKNSDDGCSDNLSYMDRVVMEVVESEAVYVRDLQQVVEVSIHF